MLNKAIMIGRLTRDPENRTTQSGDAVCTFTLAVDRPFANAQGQREADFLPVSCFRKTAENCARFLGKGRLVAVVGSIRTRNYQAQDGTKRYVTEINADEVRFLDHADRPVESAEPSGITPSFTPTDDEEELPF